MPKASDGTGPGPQPGSRFVPNPALVGRETVLLVDDEPTIRSAGARIFSRFGYQLMTAEHGGEAVALLEQADPAVDLVVTDMVMPVMDARQLILVVRRRWPALPVLLSTGYDATRIDQADLALFNGLVPKPYTAEEMLRAVRRALDRR
jgi:two-component system cell cycle sensor histidine kinase/response regulator CckA